MREERQAGEIKKQVQRKCEDRQNKKHTARTSSSYEKSSRLVNSSTKVIMQFKFKVGAPSLFQCVSSPSAKG